MFTFIPNLYSTSTSTHDTVELGLKMKVFTKFNKSKYLRQSKF